MFAASKLHHLQVDLAAFQYEAQPFVEAELILDNLGKRLVYEVIDRVIFLAKKGCMIGVSPPPPQSEHERMHQG